MKAHSDEYPSINIAKRYKLPEAAVEIIAKAGPVHGSQSRAIQIAVELLWILEKRAFDEEMKRLAPITGTPLTGKTYKLTERTIDLINSLSADWGTKGNVMAAVS